MSKIGTAVKEQPSVSIIVPVYNSAPYLNNFIRSIDSQDCQDFELIAINDGSTDESGQLLDEAAQQRSWMRVVHQENSGWAGAPRNRGIELARGEFVFFADPDDEFGTRTALSHLVKFARENSSDVVLPRVVASGGRAYAQWRYRQTQVDADLVTVFTTLTPHKLVRRALIERHSLRFPEGKIRLEDGIFFAQAYLLAERVSILTGEEFYVLVHHDDGGHLSKQGIDPASYVGTSVTRMCEFVEELAPADKVAVIIAELVKRKVLLGSQPKKVLVYKDARIRMWMAAQRDFVQRFLNTDERWDVLSDKERRLLEYALDDDVAGIRHYAQTLSVNLSVTRAKVDQSTLTISGQPMLPAPLATTFVLRERTTGKPELHSPLRNADAGWETQFNTRQLAARGQHKLIFDFYVTFTDHRGSITKRVAADGDMCLLVDEIEKYEPYTTQKGNFSLRVRPTYSLTRKLMNAVETIGKRILRKK